MIGVFGTIQEWLRVELRKRYDLVLKEEVPPSLTSLLDPPEPKNASLVRRLLGMSSVALGIGLLQHVS